MGEIRKKDSKAARQSRADSYVNVVNGLGDPSKDRTQNGTFVPAPTKTDLYYENLFAGHALARRIAELPAQEALRQGFALDLGDTDTTDKAAVMAEFDRLHGTRILTEAMAFARAMGGGVVFIGANDGGAPDQPLNLTTVREIPFLKALSKRDIIPVAGAINRDLTSEEFGKTELYQVTLTSDAGTDSTQLQVHSSRLIRFDGIVTTNRQRALNQGWGDSIYKTVEETIMLFWGSVQGLANALSDADQAIFKLDGLMDIVKGDPDGDDAVRKRLQLLQFGRSNARAIAVDADKEDFSYISRTFSGYDTGLSTLMYVVSAACGIPVTLLFGRSPGGMNATGDADVRFFYDQIKSFQETMLLPKLRRLLEVIMSAQLGPTSGAVPKDWSITFKSLWQPTALERADIRLKTAQADQIEIDTNVLAPDEARESHYGGDEYDPNIAIDTARDPVEEADQRAAEMAQTMAEVAPPPTQVVGDAKKPSQG